MNQGYGQPTTQRENACSAFKELPGAAYTHSCTTMSNTTAETPNLLHFLWNLEVSELRHVFSVHDVVLAFLHYSHKLNETNTLSNL